jgi:hypothetical protein
MALVENQIVQIDVGERQGFVTYISDVEYPGDRRVKLQCVCGKIFDALKTNFLQGKTTSCGCLRALTYSRNNGPKIGADVGRYKILEIIGKIERTTGARTVTSFKLKIQCNKCGLIRNGVSNTLNCRPPRCKCGQKSLA